MFIPWFAWPLAVQLVAVADGVPKLDVTPSCQGAAESGYIATTEERLQRCIASEHDTRDKLAQNWTNFAPADRAWCVSSIKGFQPTYTELATCLEMKRDLKETRPVDAATPATTMPRRR
jgi:hypothetical protein